MSRLHARGPQLISASNMSCEKKNNCPEFSVCAVITFREDLCGNSRHLGKTCDLVTNHMFYIDKALRIKEAL